MILSNALHQYVSLDLPPLVAAISVAISSSLLGTFLVLRGATMMGDAISHAVLPGIVSAFLLTSSRASGTMFIGAAIAGVVASLMIETIAKLGKLDLGASMSVVFSIFFAAGVLMMERAAARSVDLDADCLLYGQLETIFWSPPVELKDILTLKTISSFPLDSFVTVISAALVILFVTIFFKELTIATFDPALGTALGFSANWLNYILISVIALVIVASFKIVGSILVISMLVCPAAAARLLTDKLKTQLVLSVIIGIVAVLLGYHIATLAPEIFRTKTALNAAAGISVAAGILLLLAVILAPRHGVIARSLRRTSLGILVAIEDLVADLYREEVESLVRDEPFFRAGWQAWLARRLAIRKGLAAHRGGEIRLTEKGKEEGMRVIRHHRLWEKYLVDQMNLDPAHVHASAEGLEHFSKGHIAVDLEDMTKSPPLDPHGKPIPK